MKSKKSLPPGFSAVITGASTGIGRSLAILLATEYQAKLVINARTEDALNDTKRIVVERGRQGDSNSWRHRLQEKCPHGSSKLAFRSTETSICWLTMLEFPFPDCCKMSHWMTGTGLWMSISSRRFTRIRCVTLLPKEEPGHHCECCIRCRKSRFAGTSLLFDEQVRLFGNE